MLEAIEALGPAAWLRGSFIAYPLLNALHILALGTLITTALLMDARILGLGRSVPLSSALDVLRPVAIGALLVALASGVVLFSVRPTEYWANPAFRTKLVLLVLAISNAGLFTVLKIERRPPPLPQALALLSAALWLAVLASGRFIGFLA